MTLALDLGHPAYVRFYLAPARVEGAIVVRDGARLPVAVPKRAAPATLVRPLRRDVA